MDLAVFEDSITSRLKAGCGHEWPPHYTDRGGWRGIARRLRAADPYRHLPWLDNAAAVGLDCRELPRRDGELDGLALARLQGDALEPGEFARPGGFEVKLRDLFAGDAAAVADLDRHAFFAVRLHRGGSHGLAVRERGVAQ